MTVKAEHLHFSIGKKDLLMDISFTAQPGELLVILGANGAGKSTLLKLISKELKPVRGSVMLNRVSLRNWHTHELAKCRAVLTQQSIISLPFTATEIVMMGRYPHFRLKPTSLDHNVVGHVMNYVGISHLAHRNYLTLSGGEQQRVHLARVLSQIWNDQSQGKLLLLDEPVSALDMQYQHEVLQLLRKLVYKGFTVIAVLHDLNLALQYADRLLMLKNGKQVVYGDRSVLTEPVIKEVFNIDTHIHRSGEYSFVTAGAMAHTQFVS